MMGKHGSRQQVWWPEWRKHILKHKRETEQMNWQSLVPLNSQSPLPVITPPPIRLHLQNSLNSATSWEPNLQIYEPYGR